MNNIQIKDTDTRSLLDRLREGLDGISGVVITTETLSSGQFGLRLVSDILSFDAYEATTIKGVIISEKGISEAARKPLFKIAGVGLRRQGIEVSWRAIPDVNAALVKALTKKVKAASTPAVFEPSTVAALINAAPCLSATAYHACVKVTLVSSQRSSITLAAGGQGVAVEFSYNAEAVAAIKATGAAYDAKAKSWSVPVKKVVSLVPGLLTALTALEAARVAQEAADKVAADRRAEAASIRRADANDRRAAAALIREQNRILVARGEMSVGQVVVRSGQKMIVEGLGKLFEIGEDASSLYGSSYIGREDELVQYAYLVPATA